MSGAKPLLSDAPVRRRPNQRGDGAMLKQEVIEAAMRLLDRSPSADLGLRMIAREAGIAAPSIYKQFSDAKAVMRQVVLECWEQLGQAMSRAKAETPDGSDLDTLKARMAAYVRYAMERPSRYQLLFAMRPMSGEESDLQIYAQPAYYAIIGTIETFVDRGGIIPADDAFSAAILTLSIAHGRVALAHLAPQRVGNSARGVEQFVADMIDRLFVMPDAPNPAA